jgi:hypothetical protein
MLKVYDLGADPGAANLVWRAINENPYFEQGSKRQAKQLQEVQEKLERFFKLTIENRPEGPVEVRTLQADHDGHAYLALSLEVAEVFERAWDAFATHLMTVRSIYRTRVDTIIENAKTMSEEDYVKLVAPTPA